MNIKNTIAIFFTLLFTACNNPPKTTFTGCWELVSTTATEEGKPKKNMWKTPYELIIQEDGKCYFLNTEGVLFDSAQWILNKNELKFSKPVFAYQNDVIKPYTCTIENNTDSILILKTDVNDEDRKGSLVYYLKKKTYSSTDLTQKFKPLAYTIQDHIRNREQNSHLRLIAEKMVAEIKDPQIFILTDSIVDILDSWRYIIPNKSGGYRYAETPLLYHSPAANINFNTCSISQKADFLRLYNKLYNHDTISIKNLRPIAESLTLRYYFSNSSNKSPLDLLDKTPYKIRSKTSDDNVIQLLNDIDQSKTTLWINCIEVLSEAPRR